MSEHEVKSAVWNVEKISDFQNVFLDWYDCEKRDLPWRLNNDPYRIWISEIMLQQTRVETVIPYYFRFMDLFPYISTLAEASEDTLLKAWEGLGYYSRVRNLQKAAQQIMEDYAGEVPNTLHELLHLKGIGPYTAGAIASMAFDLPEPAIDGNIMRVVSRLFCIKEDISKASSRKTFDFYMRLIISHKRPGDFNQAMMDLGSAVCLPKNPSCFLCPIQEYCESYEQGNMLDFPVKKAKTKSKNVYFLGMAIENSAGEYLLEKRPDSGLLAKMWTFPLVEISEPEYKKLSDEWYAIIEENTILNFYQNDFFTMAENALSLQEVAEEKGHYSTEEYEAEKKDSLDFLQKVIWQKKLGNSVSHKFSHLEWNILVAYGIVKEAVGFLPENRFHWVAHDNFAAYAFPKAQQKIIESLAKMNNRLNFTI